MDKSIRSFIFFSTVWITVFFASFLLLIYAVFYHNFDRHSSVLYITMSIIALAAVLLLFTTYAISNTYKNGNTNMAYIWLVRIGKNFLLPALISLPGLFKNNKDALRTIYINISNTLTLSSDLKYPAEKILLLLPHCLQNSACKHKITQEIDNCQKCGGCCIGDIIEIAKSVGIQTIVVNGGTAARSIIKTTRPGLIIAVACERELTSGIIDIENIPVIGIINNRPNGQCNNTTVGYNDIKHALEKVVECSLN